jgi:peptidoglycan hydrolase-like protein with peptidoglycan-binding domain
MIYLGGTPGATERAVIAFQKARGLTADGVAGPKTLAALGISLEAA